MPLVTEHPSTLTAVTVAQLNKATRINSDLPFTYGKTVFGKVRLVGNLVDPKVDPDTGDLHFTLDDSTGRITVRITEGLLASGWCILPQPYEDMPFSTVVRVIGNVWCNRLDPFQRRIIHAESCSVASDTYEPYHHILSTIHDHLCNENGPFPNDFHFVPAAHDDNELSDSVSEEAAQENAGTDLPALTSSLANTRLVPQTSPRMRVVDEEIVSGSPTGHMYPPLSPLRASTSPPRAAYYPKATGDLDNTFVILDSEAAPKPESFGESSRHVYPPQPQYLNDLDEPMEAAAPIVVPATPPQPANHGFDENGDLDESFVFLESSQAQSSRANGAPYLPSTRKKLPNINLRDVSISPPSRSFLRRRSPPQQDIPSKKARIGPQSQPGSLGREILTMISNRQRAVYNSGVSRAHIIEDLTVKATNRMQSNREINRALDKLVTDAYVVALDQDHFIIN